VPVCPIDQHTEQILKKLGDRVLGVGVIGQRLGLKEF